MVSSWRSRPTIAGTEVVEQSSAELKPAGLAHLPSGRLMANAAWFAPAVIAHNQGRAVGALAGQGRIIIIATLRRRLFTTPRRLVHSARRLHLRLSNRWPWTARFAALDAIAALPSARLTSSPCPPHRRDLGEAGQTGQPSAPTSETGTRTPSPTQQMIISSTRTVPGGLIEG